MPIFRKKRVAVANDAPDDNKDNYEAIKKEIETLQNQLEKIKDFVGEQKHDNKILMGSIERLKRDVNSLKQRTD